MALSNLIWWPWFGIGGGAPPVVPEYRPVGDTGPIRRSRRRFEEHERGIQDLDDIEAISVILSEP